MEENTRFTKAHFILKISTLRETDEGLKVVDTKRVNARGSDFQRSLIQCRAAGMPRKIEIVENEPINFQVNVLYVRVDGKYVWTWVKESDLSPSVESENIEDSSSQST